MHLSGLFVHPVKSLRGCAVDEAKVDALGLVGDRRFLVVDSGGRFMTQRTLPRMALVETVFSGEWLTLSAPGSGAVRVARVSEGPTRMVAIWASEGLRTADCGDEAAEWLGAFLKTDCRLVRAGRDFVRPIPERRVPSPLRGYGGAVDSSHRVGFQDAFPFLLIGERSLDDLNDRLAAQGEDPVRMDRFRPNLVVRGSEAYAEDSWERFRIGDIVFHGAGACVRCAVPTVDQRTAERGREPLATLASYRRYPEDPTKVIFGQNLIHETKAGRLRVGDAIVVA